MRGVRGRVRRFKNRLLPGRDTLPAGTKRETGTTRPACDPGFVRTFDRVVPGPRSGIRQYASALMTSPPLMDPRALHTDPAIDDLMNRTLPSARSVLTPPGAAVLRWGGQSSALKVARLHEETGARHIALNRNTDVTRLGKNDYKGLRNSDRST